MYRILIIEDSQFIRHLLKENLTELEMEIIEETGDPRKGIELFKELKPDVVMIDYSLPYMSGIEVAEKILAQNIYAHLVLMIPIRLLSKTQELVSMGFKSVITKPFYPEQLQSTMIEVVASF